MSSDEAGFDLKAMTIAGKGEEASTETVAERQEREKQELIAIELEQSLQRRAELAALGVKVRPSSKVHEISP
jgi:hypothetical protein